MEHQQTQACWMEPLWHQSFWAMQNCKLGETRSLNVFFKFSLVFKDGFIDTKFGAYEAGDVFSYIAKSIQIVLFYQDVVLEFFHE